MIDSALTPLADSATRISRIRLHPVLHQMPDSHAYGMARGLTAARGATIVEIETNTGVTGWGEAWGPPDFPAAYLGMVEARWLGARLTDHAALFHCQTASNIFHPAAPKTFQFRRPFSAVSAFA